MPNCNSACDVKGVGCARPEKIRDGAIEANEMHNCSIVVTLYIFREYIEGATHASGHNGGHGVGIKRGSE